MYGKPKTLVLISPKNNFADGKLFKIFFGSEHSITWRQRCHARFNGIPLVIFIQTIFYILLFGRIKTRRLNNEKRITDLKIDWVITQIIFLRKMFTLYKPMA